MGITGLLPFLKPASHPTNIRQYSGCTVAVDSYCWLHKGAFSCADKLAKGEPTDGYVIYCMKMVNSLIAAGVRPIMVFDGQNLPSKAGTEKKRREERQNQKRKGRNYLIDGKLKEARECFQRCTEVTSDMALDLIKACRKIGVDCIVAPYEADAQLAYLNKIGIAQIVITEDSDLVLFGCEKIFYKMDINGNGIMVEKSEIVKCFEKDADSFDFDKFRYMCIMSGCDYLPSLNGIGLKKAIKFFLKTNKPNLNVVLSKIPIYLKMPSVVVTNDYIEHFKQANNTFLYQLVYDPLKRRLVPLNPYENGLTGHDIPYAGRLVSNEIAFQIAVGNINVDTMEKVENFDPDVNLIKAKSVSWSSLSQPKAKSIWDPDYSNSSTRFTIKPPIESVKSVKLTSSSLFERNSDRKRPIDTELSSISGIADEELLLMYKSETRMSKLSRITSDLSDCGKASLTNSLPTLQCSSYFSTSDKSESSLKSDSSQNDDIVESPIVDTPSKSPRLKFDQSLSTKNHVKLNNLFTSNLKPNCTAKTKCHDLFQRFGYQVNSRLTLSPSNHTPFKPVVLNHSNNASDSQYSTQSSQSQEMSQDNSVSGASQETFISFSDSQPSDNESLSQIDSLDDKLKYKFNTSIPVLTSKEISRSNLESSHFFSPRTTVLKKCKIPGLSRRNSIMLPVQPTDTKKQLSIKESLAKYQFIKARKPFL